MKLYYSPGACSLAPHIALCEAAIPHQLVKVDLKAHTLENGGDFYAVNPKGYVPVLELDDGQRLTEVPVVTQYIADRKPESGLAPAAGTMERYRLQEWLNFVTAELHKSLGSMFNPAMSEDWRKVVKERAGERLRFLSGALEGKRFLMGERFTIADGYLFTVLNWMKFFEMTLDPWPVVKDHFERVGARPKVREALQAEGIGG